MSSVGDTLRTERLRKNLSLEQIARETKINSHLLDAIETNQFDLLPRGVFAKSFVRQYARFLGLDEEEMAAEVQRAMDPGAGLPSFAVVPAQPAYKVPKVTRWEGAGARQNSSALPSLAMLVVVMLVCSGIYAWWLRSRHPAQARALGLLGQQRRPGPNRGSHDGCGTVTSRSADPGADCRADRGADPSSR